MSTGSRHQCTAPESGKDGTDCHHGLTSTELYSIKPIGYLRTPFLFKNGTPRQPTVCGQARGELTVLKSVFNNPEHSIEGLQHFTHVWCKLSAENLDKLLKVRLTSEEINFSECLKIWRKKKIRRISH